MKHAREAEPHLRAAIHNLRVRCFRFYPDYEISGIGGECPETLTRLNELMASTWDDELVHLATDNPSAPRDVPSWVASRRYKILEEGKEGNLLHFILGK